MLPFTHTWLPFIYLYSLGGILFLIGVIITYRMGSLDLKRKHHRKWFGLLFFGFLYYMALHSFLNLAALGHTNLAWLVAGILLVLSVMGFFLVRSRLRSES